jgi:hypothetical protein
MPLPRGYTVIVASLILWSSTLHVRFAFKTFFFALALVCTASLLLSCGNDFKPNTLTLTPSSYNITVNSATGTSTGNPAIQVALNGKAVDITTVFFNITSTNGGVSPSCFGVDLTGVPHCNSGCGTAYSGVITATVTAPATTTATATIACQVQ